MFCRLNWPASVPSYDSLPREAQPRVCLPLLKIIQKRMRKARASVVSLRLAGGTYYGQLYRWAKSLFILGDCANGELPENLLPLIMGARMVTLDKGGPDGGVRPVAVGELFIKMAEVGALTTVVKEAAIFLAKGGQVGVATKGGLDYIIHSVQAALLTDAEIVVALIFYFIFLTLQMLMVRFLAS